MQERIQTEMEEEGKRARKERGKSGMRVRPDESSRLTTCNVQRKSAMTC